MDSTFELIIFTLLSYVRGKFILYIYLLQKIVPTTQFHVVD